MDSALLLPVFLSVWGWVQLDEVTALGPKNEKTLPIPSQLRLSMDSCRERLGDLSWIWWGSTSGSLRAGGASKRAAVRLRISYVRCLYLVAVLSSAAQAAPGTGGEVDISDDAGDRRLLAQGNAIDVPP